MGQQGLGLMSQTEAQRWVVLQGVKGKTLSQSQAAQQLDLSVRQIKRLCRRMREQGASGLISKRRGAPSNRRIAAEVREHTLGLVRQHYADFGPELAREYLASEHGVAYNTETLRGWMIAAGLWKPKTRRARRVHPPRPRRDCLGELVQIDGSHHDWFEARAAKCCLTAFIDDATGRVLAARFDPTETTQGYLGVLRRHIEQHGVPLALYGDRHSIFTKHDPEDGVPTQFERALLQLDIEPICANSPQAKGRVERLFQTLQDRLVKAMRLAGISDIDAANAWLPGYMAQHNQRFAVAPCRQADMHRPWLGGADKLASLCALHHQRQLSAQLSCRFEGQVVQVEPGQMQAPKARAMVDIAQHRDGRLELSYRGQTLRHQRYACNDHLNRIKVTDAKTVSQRVDQAVDEERRRLSALSASIAHQDAQRSAGIYEPDSPPNAPRARGRGALRATPFAALAPRASVHQPPNSKGDISTWSERGASTLD